MAGQIVSESPQTRPPAVGGLFLLRKLRPFALQLYRFAVLAAIVLLVREHHVRLRIEGHTPITVSEVSPFLPQAAALQPDHSERAGMFVHDNRGDVVGYVVRTSPACDGIIGYCGPTDTLIAFNREMKIAGLRVRSSIDTKNHVADIRNDQYFMTWWNGKSWDDTSGLDPKKAGVEGVSGATLTSMGMAYAISHRLKHTNEQLAFKPNIALRGRDISMGLILLTALLIAFSPLRGKIWLRRVFQAVVLVFVGFVNADLIAQTLLIGWASSGVPWHIAPGVVLLVAAALFVPLTTRRALYCQQLCPHGVAQEWLHRISPLRGRLRLPRGVDRGLRWLPLLLLALTLATSMLLLPLDLAGIEPFDAYMIRSAGWATIAVAIVGLLASLFVPMAYCKYGCPTGALLEFVRSHGANDRFSRRDFAAAALLLLALWLYYNHAAVNTVIAGPLN